jgi:hypothetical protein
MGDNFHDLRSGHAASDAHLPSAVAHLLPDGQCDIDPQRSNAVGDTFTSQPPTAKYATATIAGSPSYGWLELRTFAELYEDTQRTRIASANRVLATGRPEMFAEHIEAMRRTEHECSLMLFRCYRRVVPVAIRQWQEDTPGIGEAMLPRLLGHLGHPVLAMPHHWEGKGDDRHLVADVPYERTVSQLWQYCGHGDPARRIAKGISAEDLAAIGSPRLKMLVHLNAVACFRCVGTTRSRRSPYRDVYEARRLVTADRVHAAPCVRCGPSGRPAAEGSPWSAAHQHADALRIVGKEILRDLWRVSQ